MYWSITKFYKSNLHALASFRLTMLAYPCMGILLSMCTPRTSGRAHGFLAMDSLLNAQAGKLSQARATLHKEIRFGDETEAITVVPADTTAWLKELEVFAAIDAINKPINRDRYQVSDASDPKSNLRVKEFLTRDDLPVKSVRLYYYRVPESLRKIEALYIEHNGLYKNSRNLSMEFSDFNGLPVMTSYAIAGGQKMFLDDTVQYDIKGKVRMEIK